MSRIRVLPPEVVNRIAAGEVVERPASVVKELAENAIDAQATEVTVVLEDGGKKRILVRDNGCGMSPEDLKLAFESHATSKLRDADLESNQLGFASLGFRGEALPSIASVAMVEAVSLVSGGEHAYRFRPGSGEPEPCAGESGTAIEIGNLFYNTPARRKFLRAGSTELSHVVQLVSRLAMGFPAVRFRLFHGKRSVLDLSPADSIGERLRQIVPRTISDHLVEVREGDDPELPSIAGFVGKPRVHRRDTKEQHFFVNGRWIRDRTLTHALRSAFQGFQISGYQPVAYLFLDFPRGDVDANVHPTKTEVRFRDPSSIYRLVHHAVRRAIESSGDALDSPTGEDGAAAGASAVAGAGAEEARSEREREPTYTMQDLFAEIAGSGPRSRDSATVRGSSAPPASTRNEGATEDFPPAEGDGPWTAGAPPETSTSASAAAVGVGAAERSPEGSAPDSLEALADSRRVLQVLDSYLVVEVAGGVLFVDQHALHEIILFEEIYRRLLDGIVESQKLLVPEVVRIPAEYVPLVERASEILGRFGFELEAFGPDSVAFHSLPALFDREAGRTDTTTLALSVLEEVQRGVVATAGHRSARGRDLPASVDEQLRDIGATIACKRAVKAGTRLADEEIQSLLERGSRAFDPRHCPHGRPTAVFHARRDIERLFDRK